MAQLLDWLTSIDKVYFTQAQVTLSPVSYEGTSILSKIYLMFLHEMCLVFGNVYEACLIAHFASFLVAAFVWYLAIRKLYQKVIPAVLTTLCVFVPLGVCFAVSLNPFVLPILLFGIVFWAIINCIKGLVAGKSKEVVVTPSTKECIQEEPVVTVVNFDEEPAVVVPDKTEKTAIFIPKSMEIPKRASKPKLDYALEVSVNEMFYDVDPPIQDDFDFLP